MSTPTIAALHAEVKHLHRERARLAADVKHLTATLERLHPAIRARLHVLRTEAAPPTTHVDVTAKARLELAALGPDPEAGQHMRDLRAATTTKENR